MINNLVVLNTVQDNGADAIVDYNGNLNVTRVGAFPAIDIQDIQKISAQSEQICKSLLTFTSQATTSYDFIIEGYSMATGVPKSVTIPYSSPASSSTSIISAATTLVINNTPDFNVVATDNGSGVVALAGKTATATSPNAPLFAVKESSSLIAVTAPLTVSFTAAPTGGRTARATCVVSDAGALTGLIITDPGEGYVTAPLATFAGGAGSSAAATMMIFEGQVVGTSAITPGSGYTCRVGLVAQGTFNALNLKYGAKQPAQTNAVPLQFPELNNLETGSTYDEWIISYNKVTISGNTTFATITETKQISILVKTGVTNVNTLNSFWGTLANLKKGYKTVINDGGTCSITNTALTDGVITYTATAPNALVMGIMPNDIIAIGTAPTPSTAAGAVVRAIGITSVSSGVASGLFVTGSGLVAATAFTAVAYKHVKRRPIAL